MVSLILVFLLISGDNGFFSRNLEFVCDFKLNDFFYVICVFFYWIRGRI